MKTTPRAAIILLLLASISLQPAWAELVSARILLGTREATVAPAPVFDGKRVLAPVTVLNSLGASYVASTSGDSVSVLAVGGQSGDIATIDVDGKQMLPMDKVMELIGGDSAWDGAKRILTLNAWLQSVEFVDGVLKVNCTFPVVCSVNEWDGKIIVDVPGTKLVSEAKEVYIGSDIVARARLGQYDDSTARVVLETNKAAGWKVESRLPSAQLQVRIAAGLPRPQPSPPAKSTPGKGRPYTIGDIRLESVDENRCSVVLATSGKGGPVASYGVLPPQIVLDLPGATLADGAGAPADAHPLIDSLKVRQVSSSPAKARITIDLARIVSYSLSTTDSATTLDIRLPDSAGGKLSGKLIVIDPGHGGREKGAQGGGVFEKNLNYSIAQAVARALEAEGARTMFTRDGDYVIGLAARPEVALNNRADFFVSIHCNSNGVLNSATGIETYYHMQEGSPRALAYAIHAGVCASTGMCDRRARSDGALYSSGLGVLRRLRGTGLPGVLLECGFINNSADRARLVSSDYRRKLAEGIVAGLKAYVEGTPIE